MAFNNFLKLLQKRKWRSSFFNKATDCWLRPLSEVDPGDPATCDMYGSQLSHSLDKPNTSKDIFLLYVVYQMKYLIYRITDIDILSISIFEAYPHPFKLFKGCLPQNLLRPLLNTLSCLNIQWWFIKPGISKLDLLCLIYQMIIIVRWYTWYTGIILW